MTMTVTDGIIATVDCNTSPLSAPTVFVAPCRTPGGGLRDLGVIAEHYGPTAAPETQANDASFTTHVDGRTSTTSGPTHRTPTVPRR